ncbi:MAG: LysR family transcriptional regulator [Alphaproteobacteria bacterium]|nr:LysR family transcriptional regulator [Alphaproteobacteria bacterium]MBF0394730.1 LysR family transcriptional regulator [Alphaproteobacteria bacterium]
MDRLTSMEVFARVVEAHGFSAAARELGVSKSAVSKIVAQTEERLGARLLNRTTRRLSPTAAGTAFYERCLRVMAEAEEAELAVTSLQAEPRGVLKLNAPMSFGILHLAPALPDFMVRFPDVTVDLTLNDRMVDLVDEGFDLAVRIARLTDSSLVARRLAPSRRVWCASPEYFARHGTPARPADLAGHDCLIYTYTTSGDEWRWRGPAGEGSVRLKGSLRANNGQVLHAALLAGRGIAPMPTFMVGPDLRAGRLQAVLTEYEEEGASVYAVWPSARLVSTKVRVFVDFLATRFGPRPYWEP